MTWTDWTMVDERVDLNGLLRGEYPTESLAGLFGKMIEHNRKLYAKGDEGKRVKVKEDRGKLFRK